jgi:hypothetical protein
MSTPAKPYICQYCNHGYSRESTLITHVCEQKRRALAQSEKHVVIGFDTYQRFYKLTQNAKHEKTYVDFSKSPYYNAFVKFGSFVNNVNPLYPNHFIDYVIKSGVKLDHWCRDELYDKYVVELIRSENVETALQRSIDHMLLWADNNNSSWNHYFLYVSLSRATYDIKDGKVSPWLILNSSTGKQLLKRLNDEQLQLISPVIDPQFWLVKFKRLQSDTDMVKHVIKESNL